MLDIDKKKILEANARKKYVSRDRRSFRRPERRVEGRLRDRYRINEAVKERKPLTEEEKRDLSDRIKNAKNPDELKKWVKKALEHDLKVSEEILEKVKKQEKARENMKYRIEEMKSRSLSATEKDAVMKIQNGRADLAMKELKSSGRDGELGNEIAENSLVLAENAQKFSENSNIKDTNSIIMKMLKDNSVPADTLYERKREDKSDQNKEGIRYKDSTEKQMTNAYMAKLRGAAYGG